MSSRALRKLQKERERLQQEQGDEEAEDEDHFTVTSKAGGFEMLGEEQEENVDDESEQEKQEENIQQDADENSIVYTPSTTQASKARGYNKSRKRKKKEKASKETNHEGSKGTDSDQKVDEIDAALNELSTHDRTSLSTVATQAETDRLMSRVLAIDTHHLHVGNEMKRLFGRAAIAADNEEREQSRQQQQRQARAGGEIQLSLAEAVTGRYSQNGPGLPAVLRRRNIFIQGKEEWPRATGNGLVMEIEKTQPSGVVVYRFVHKQPYQVAQATFAQCVAMMDPQTMVSILRTYPYHVSTLLQVSEISKQEKDYATAGELLERALFAFGKALHPTFASNLTKGMARLSFRRPENREFFLAAWRYIKNISMRATWRTAYEWARLLLSLDPVEDPYSIRFVIDQFAIRSRQWENFLSLATSYPFRVEWQNYPNIKYSMALALRMKDNKSSDCQNQLAEAVVEFPWVAARLCQEIGIEKIPTSVWGFQADTECGKLRSEVYVSQGKDMWKLPETSKFLRDVISEISRERINPVQDQKEIDMNEARHVLLTEDTSLIGLVPREFTEMLDSASDPLPPKDNLMEYDVDMNRERKYGPDARELIATDPQRFIDEMNHLQASLEMVMSSDQNGQQRRLEGNEQLTEQEISQAIRDSGIPILEMRARLARYTELRDALMDEANHTVEAADGVSASLESRDGIAIFQGVQPDDYDEGAARREFEEAVERDMDAAARNVDDDSDSGE